MKPIKTYLLLGLTAGLLQGCSHPALRQAEALTRSQDWPQAYALLTQARLDAPDDAALRAAQLRMGAQLTARLLTQIEGQRASARWDEAAASLQQLRELDPKHPRLSWWQDQLQRGQRQESQIAQARSHLQQGKLDAAEALARAVLAESPQHALARLLINQIGQARPLEAGSRELGPAFQKPINLEFREAPLRQVFEALARSSNINFVFDKEVRVDSKVSLFLRQVSLDEAMRVLLSTQQLDRKLLNDNSVLIYPNTAAKQREHQELITRTLYLVNAEVGKVQALVRGIAKVRDIHIDERLNLMVIRDTPEVMRLVERLIASVDLPDAEVMLEVEVMELASDRLHELGLKWPEQLSFGLLGAGLANGQVELSRHGDFRASIANPAVVATLRGGSGSVTTLANPKIRVRNHDKALVHIGQKVPVFTTTTNFTGSTSVAASVTMLEVGLKLDVEPSIQLDNDVIIKVGLEVSNLIRQVTGPGGTTAYEIGTRKTATTLRLNDGETQVLAGLISDEDRSSASGIPGLSAMPLVGSLFGQRNASRNKSEVVLLITPRIVRNLALPDAALTRLPGGTDASPGAFSSLLKPSTKVSVGPAQSVASTSAPPTPQAAPPTEALLRLDVTPQVSAGGTLAVTLKNESGLSISGDIEFDASLLQAAQDAPGATSGRLSVELPARGDKVVILRALPKAKPQALNINVINLSASGLNGEQATVRLEGSGLVALEAAK